MAWFLRLCCGRWSPLSHRHDAEAPPAVRSDFADIYLLTRHHPVDGADLDRCLREVATYRQATLEPLSTILDGYDSIGRQGWAAWRRRNQLGDLVPDSFAELLGAVTAFADPVLSATAPRLWDPDAGRWI